MVYSKATTGGNKEFVRVSSGEYSVEVWDLIILENARPSLIMTGGAGFLAQYVQRLLCDKFAITLADIDLSTDSEAGIVPCDVSKFDSVSSLFEKVKPAAVIHLAAITGVERCQVRPLESFLVNVVGTFNIAWLCAKFNSRLVFASSREVYGETIGNETAEDAEPHPNNFYGLTKQLGESMIQWLGRSLGLRYVVLRFTNLYGPGGDQYAVAALIKKALQAEEIPILGGTQVLNMIHVEDAARAVQMSLEKTEPSCAVFNIGSENTISVVDLVRLIVNLTGSRSKTKVSPMRPGDTAFFKPDLAKANRDLGFVARISLDQGLRECIEHYRTMSNGT